jgi:hypothetical protein
MPDTGPAGTPAALATSHHPHQAAAATTSSPARHHQSPASCRTARGSNFAASERHSVPNAQRLKNRGKSATKVAKSEVSALARRRNTTEASSRRIGPTDASPAGTAAKRRRPISRRRASGFSCTDLAFARETRCFRKAPLQERGNHSTRGCLSLFQTRSTITPDACKMLRKCPGGHCGAAGGTRATPDRWLRHRTSRHTRTPTGRRPRSERCGVGRPEPPVVSGFPSAYRSRYFCVERYTRPGSLDRPRSPRVDRLRRKL